LKKKFFVERVRITTPWKFLTPTGKACFPG